MLYRTEPAQFRRFLQAMAAACSHARQRGSLGTVVLAAGDSSPTALPEASDLGAFLGPHPFERLDYEFFGDNLGSAGGHNRLFAGLEQDLVLVMNPDTYASPRMVTELVDAMADDDVGVVEARQLPLEHPKSHDHLTGDTSWASGSCFMARAQVIRDTGGFDPDLFFLYCDDVDFSWRARLRGWRVVHRPSARVFHDKRLSDGGTVLAGEAELRYSAEAAVLLAWRYSRADLALETLASLEGSAEDVHREVAAALRRRLDGPGRPEPIDPAHEVGQFVGTDYAVHRFSYSEP